MQGTSQSLLPYRYLQATLAEPCLQWALCVEDIGLSLLDFKNPCFWDHKVPLQQACRCSPGTKLCLDTLAAELPRSDASKKC